MAYRGIDPARTFESEVHPTLRRQFHWIGSGGLETALFAGKEMMVCLNDDGRTYQLTYLDFADPTDYTSIEDAKANAPDFARAVLLRMIEYVGVREDDHSLRACLDRGGQ
ncbi:hypothetical protein [Marinobacterium sp. BA1]|uniref:hypothetical protein n=1 Tax=Marinobacterium sp. BA1 TaxID=3138931 RepID=UPI0032E5A5FF